MRHLLGDALGETQSITEEGVPSGYAAPAIGNVEVTAGDCDRLTGDPVVVPVENIPLTDLFIEVTSQHSGATISQIRCEPGEHSSGPFSDPATLSLTDLEPGTVVCEIEIDP